MLLITVLFGNCTNENNRLDITLGKTNHKPKLFKQSLYRCIRHQRIMFTLENFYMAKNINDHKSTTKNRQQGGQVERCCPNQ